LRTPRIAAAHRSPCWEREPPRTSAIEECLETATRIRSLGALFLQRFLTDNTPKSGCTSPVLVGTLGSKGSIFSSALSTSLQSH
jgi:hypothetical protein